MAIDWCLCATAWSTPGLTREAGHGGAGALTLTVALHLGTRCGGRHARGILHHGTLALQVVLVDGALLLLPQTALLINALILGVALPDTWVAHHT